MKILGKMAYAMVTAVLVLILVWNCYQVWSMKMLHMDLPQIFGWSQAVVLSGSMEPVISAGDLILIHREEDYMKGDIITFSDHGSLVTHRIEEKTENGFVTRGDANNVTDSGLVDRERIRGRAAAVIPGIGYAILFLRSQEGLLLIAVLSALLIWGKGWTGSLSKRGRSNER